MTFLERFDNAERFWGLVLPSIPLPPDSTLVGWLGNYSDKDFERACLNVPHRIRNWETKYGEVDSVSVYKLISGYLNHLRHRRAKVKEAI